MANGKCWIWVRHILFDFAKLSFLSSIFGSSSGRKWKRIFHIRLLTENPPKKRKSSPRAIRFAIGFVEFEFAFYSESGRKFHFDLFKEETTEFHESHFAVIVIELVNELCEMIAHLQTINLSTVGLWQDDFAPRKRVSHRKRNN